MMKKIVCAHRIKGYLCVDMNLAQQQCPWISL